MLGQEKPQDRIEERETRLIVDGAGRVAAGIVVGVGIVRGVSSRPAEREDRHAGTSGHRARVCVSVCGVRGGSGIRGGSGVRGIFRVRG